ncbi:MAG: ferritin-like domain-containing protein [Anaerolineales bacterium]
MKITSLESLLVDELKDIYSAENQLIKAMPRIIKTADSKDLRTTLEQHLQETERHVQRLEEICRKLETSPKGKKCTGMEGLIEEAVELLKSEGDNESLEAGLIGAAQRIEHYEIAAYGTARAHARQLGFVEAVKLLSETLEEEKLADKKLTKVAENGVNVQAAMTAGDRLESL